jgi:hypothetical protein
MVELKILKTKNCFLIALGMVFLAMPGRSHAKPGEVSLSFDAVGAQASSEIPLTATRGIGLSGSADYRLSDFFAVGLTGGLVEFIAPPNMQDMKTIWLDGVGRFYPFNSSPVGEAYLQLGFGVCPHLGLFPDYWPNYTIQGFGGNQYYQEPPGTIYWNAQIVAGYVFSLGKDWGLDTGIEYDYFWPPASTPLQTIGLRTGLVFSFSLDAPKKAN